MQGEGKGLHPALDMNNRFAAISAPLHPPFAHISTGATVPIETGPVENRPNAIGSKVLTRPNVNAVQPNALHWASLAREFLNSKLIFSPFC